MEWCTVCAHVEPRVWWWYTVCAYVESCVCGVVHCVCICGNQGRMSSVFLLCSSPYSLRQGLTLSMNLAFWAESADQGALRIHLSPPSTAGVFCTCAGPGQRFRLRSHAHTLDKCSDPLTHPPRLGVQSFLDNVHTSSVCQSSARWLLPGSRLLGG